MTIGEKIKNIRESKGLTQIQLSELSKIHVSTIRKYELGIRNPKPDQIERIANGLGVSSYMFYDFDIETVGDVISILFALEDNVDIEFEGEQTDDDKYIPKTMSIKFKNPYLQDFLAKWANMTQYLNSMKNALPSVKSSIELPDGSDSVQEAVRKNINEQYLSFKNLYSINSKSNVVVKKGTDGIKVRISNNDEDNK